VITSLLRHIPLDDNPASICGELWYPVLSVKIPKLLIARVHFNGPQFDLVTLLQLVIKVI
jgi:hypothetical protein